MITTPATRAAFRLATSLPGRTHVRKDVQHPRWTRDISEDVMREARRLEREGLKRLDMARQLGIGRDTLRKYLGARHQRAKSPGKSTAAKAAQRRK